MTDKKATIKDTGLRAIIELLMKMSLMNAQARRELMSTWRTTIIVKNTDGAAPVLTAMKQEGRYKLGPPGPGIYMARLEALELLDVGGANRTSLQEQIDTWKEVEHEEIIEEAPIIKTMKCYSDEDAKVVISIRDRSFAKVVNDSFKQLEGKVCTGKAPAGYLERELGEWLEALNAS